MHGHFVNGAVLNRAVTPRADAAVEQTQAASSTACELCGRSQLPLTRHHLIPQSRHGRNRTKLTFEKDEMLHRVALLCRPCHEQVHAVLDNTALVQHYNTLEALAAQPDIAKFSAWIASKPASLKVTIRQKK
jgi:5-methylcytosine-specific restriction endonuclease McrA